MRGRKPVPTPLKLLRGNPGKRAVNKQEPKAPPGRPRKPAGLGREEGRLWDLLVEDLEAIGVLSAAHRAAMLITVDAMADLFEARKAIEGEGGPTYESVGDDGKLMVRARPEVAIKAEARRFIKAMLSEFGLTPAAATRIKVGTEEAEDRTENFLFGKSAG